MCNSQWNVLCKNLMKDFNCKDPSYIAHKSILKKNIHKISDIIPLDDAALAILSFLLLVENLFA